jgi:hypothetical protein
MAATANSSSDESSCSGSSSQGAIGVAVLPHVGVLQPGQMVKIRVSLDPQAEGPIRVFGVCSVDGMTAPRGFVICGAVQGLQVGYSIFSLLAWQAAGCPGQEGPGGNQLCAASRGASAASAGKARSSSCGGLGTGAGGSRAISSGGGSSKPLVADFGVCQLGRPASCVVVLSNATSMAADVSAWVSQHPAAADQQLHWTVHTSPAAAEGCSSVGSAGSSGRTLSPLVGGRQHRICLSTSRGSLAPFLTSDSFGNQMMATRREQAEAAAALSSSGSSAVSSRSVIVTTAGLQQLQQHEKQRPLALALAPSTGRLAPHSSMAIELVMFSGLPGTFCDALNVQVGDLAPRPIPVVVEVEGSPLILQKDRVVPAGLPAHHSSSSGPSSSGDESSSGGVMPPFGSARAWGQDRSGLAIGLELGEVPVGMQLQRTFYVRNTACAAMELEWQREPAEAAAGGKVAAEEPAGNESPAAAVANSRDFDVQPSCAVVIQPGQLQQFTVKFISGAAGRHTARLVGCQRLLQPAEDRQPDSQQQDDVTGVTSSSAGLTVALWETGSLHRPLALRLLGGFFPQAGPPRRPLPQLQLMAAATATCARLELASGAAGIDFSCPSTFARESSTHPAYLKSAVLTNPAVCPLAFRLGVEGPFELVAATASAPAPYRRRDQQQSASDAAAAAADAPGRLICLPPQESVAVRLRFAPRLVVTEALQSSMGPQHHSDSTVGSSRAQRVSRSIVAPSLSGVANTQLSAPSKAHSQAGSGSAKHSRVSSSREDYSAGGSLVISHANGERQLVPLSAAMTHPAVECSTALVDFGEVHPQAPKPIEVILTNPMTVDAAWSVVEIAAAGAPSSVAGAKSAAAAVAPAAAAAGQPPARLTGSRSEALPHLAPRDGTRNGALLAGMLVATPTSIPARPSGAAGAAGTGSGGAAAATTTASFGLFTVTPASGVLPGRGLGLPRSQRVTVQFAPGDSAASAVRLRIAVEAGRGFELGMEGRGTYDEAKEFQAHLKRF